LGIVGAEGRETRQEDGGADEAASHGRHSPYAGRATSSSSHRRKGRSRGRSRGRRPATIFHVEENHPNVRSLRPVELDALRFLFSFRDKRPDPDSPWSPAITERLSVVGIDQGLGSRRRGQVFQGAGPILPAEAIALSGEGGDQDAEPGVVLAVE